MKNPSSLSGKVWFWLGVILIVIGVLTAIFRIRLWFSSEVILIVVGALVALVGILGPWSGVILIAIGAWTAIAVLPALFVSIGVFALIGGLGLLISYQYKEIRRALLWGLGLAALGYLFFIAMPIVFEALSHTSTNYYARTDITLLFGLLTTVVPIAVLGTLVIAWLGRDKLSPDSKTLSAFKKLVPITLLIATPFIIAGLSDFNYRGDPNHEVIDLRIVDKRIAHGYSSEGEYDIFVVKGETLDGNSWFSFSVSTKFYNEHDIGSYCWIDVYNGAWGYACISQLTYGD